MAKDPAFLFYPGDWLSGTHGFSIPEKGAYIELLICQFNIGHLSILKIERILGNEYFKLWETCLKDKFLIDEQGLFYSQRLEFEQLKRKKYSESRRENKKSYDEHMKNISSSCVQHMENENRNINKNIINKGGQGGNAETETETKTEKPEIKSEVEKMVDEIYLAYPRRAGSGAAKKAILKSFSKIKPKDLLKKVQDYADFCTKTKKELQFTPLPATWFNQERFFDELEINKKTEIGLDASYVKPEYYKKYVPLPDPKLTEAEKQNVSELLSKFTEKIGKKF